MRRVRLLWIVLPLCVARGALAGPLAGTVTQLTTGSPAETQSSPAVSGSKIVWTGFNRATSNFDIFLYDLPSMAAPVNLTNTPDQNEYLEDIDGSSVVWTHNSAVSRGDVVLYDALSGSRDVLAQGSTVAHFEQPAVRGRYITYLRVSEQNGQTDVDGYDNLLGLPFPALLTNDAAEQKRPRVAGDWVVYEDYGAGNADVYAARISTLGPPVAIAASAAPELSPDVDGDTIVFVRGQPGQEQIFAYNLVSGATTQLTTVASAKVLPRISGRRVVWADDRNGNLDLYSYDLAAGAEQAVVVGAGDQFLSDIDGDRIVYTSNASGFEEVYLFTVAGGAPPPALPAGCDPALTDAAGAPEVMHTTSRRPVYVSRKFTAQGGRDYYACFENGLPDGSERTGHFLFGVDGKVLATPADFRPLKDPPRWVAVAIPGDYDDNHGHGQGAAQRQWVGALFGPNPPSTLTVTIRVAK